VDSPSDRKGLTPRHWTVLGSIRFGRRPMTPQTIARELGMDLEEVAKLLDDLARGGFDLTPRRER
jgi:hypothetical protein